VWLAVVFVAAMSKLSLLLATVVLSIASYHNMLVHGLLLEESKYVSNLDPEAYQEVVQNSSLLWVNFWYDESDGGKSTVLARYLAEAAEATHKHGVRFSAIDATANPEFSKKNGVTNTPMITLCVEPPTKYSNSGKYYRTAAGVQNTEVINSATLLKKLISQQLPNKVKIIKATNEADLETFAGAKQKEGFAFIGIHLTKKNKVSPTLKSVSMRFIESLPVVDIEGIKSVEDGVARKFGVTKLPAFVLMRTDPKVDDEQKLVMEGKPIFENIESFVINSNVPTKVDLTDIEEEEKQDIQRKGLRSDADFALTVLSSSDAWVVVVAKSKEFEELEQDLLDKTIAKGRSQGKTQVTVIQCEDVEKMELCNKLNDDGVAVLYLSYPYGLSGNKKAMSSHKSLKKAFIAASDTLPSGLVKQVNAMTFQQSIAHLVQSESEKLPLLLLSNKYKPPKMLETVAADFGKNFEFLFLPNPPEEFLISLGNVGVPSLTLLFIIRNQEEPEKLGMQGVGYDPSLMGKFSYSSISKWLSTTMRQMGIQQKTADDSDILNGHTAQPKEVTFAELSNDNFASNCVDVGGLCLVALFNPSDDNSVRIDMLEKLHAERRVGYAYSWMPAFCHLEFVSQFGVDEFALPTLVAISPKKKAFARFIGKFDSKDIDRFARGVMAGRGNIQKLSQDELRPPDKTSEECQAHLQEIMDVNREDDSSSNDDFKDDDIAEFLREATAEREAEEAAAAAAEAEAEANRDPCDDPNLNEWGQKECRAKAARKRELEEEKQRLADEIRAKRKAKKKGKKKKGKKSKTKKNKKKLEL
jgi:hypothetical protein